MQIFLKINTGTISQFNEEIIRVGKMSSSSWVENQIMLSESDLQSHVATLKTKSKTLWLIGDPIIEKSKWELISNHLDQSDITNLLQAVSGHYRMLVLDKENNVISISSSLFGILPVFYHRIGNFIYIASDAKSISEASGQRRLNKRFILENILFYYPLFNQTAYHNIFLLAAHHVALISAGDIRFTKHTRISDWFIRQPKPWKKATGEMADLFIDRVSHYLPDDPYIHALTGGFDGRCLVACGLYHQKNFETYSFGNEFSEDTRIASKLAGLAKLHFNLIKLDNDYIANHSLENGLQFITHSEGNAGFARAHYLFACKVLSRRYRYLVTGNFGSEVFRAAHNAGSLISHNLYHLFQSASVDEAIRKIEASPEFQWINSITMKQAWDEIKSDLAGLPVFSNEYSGMTLNEKFYMLVFEEVFRKYFGAEMVNQFFYLSNRTPFLDLVFLKEILKTGLAGVHSNFFENNPFRRFKGQVLYAHIIRKTYPLYNEVLSDKGYRPKDLLSLWGKLLIAKGYYKKRMTSSKKETDPNSVDLAFAHNKSYFQKHTADPAIFNTGQIKSAFDANQAAHDFLIALSQSWFHNRLQEGMHSNHKIKFQTNDGQQILLNGKY